MFDDDEPKKKPKYELGQDLAKLSIDELEEIKQELRAEIDRLEAARAGKAAEMNVAESFFKK